MLDTFDCPICSKTNLPSTLGSMIDAYKERALVWYDFSEGSGAVLGDKSWSAKDAAITGATWDGNSLHFAGTDHAIAASPAIPATAITKVTVLLKVKCAQNAAWQWFLDNGQSTPNGEISVLRRQAADWLNFRYSNGTIAGAEIKDESFFTGFDNEFVFIAVTADYVTPFAVKIYRNGEGVVYTANMTTPVAPTGARALEIGALTGGSYGLVGDIALVAIIPEVLTATEIEECFFLNLAAPTGRNVVFEGDSLIANYYDGAEQHWGSNKVEELMVDENYNRYLNVGTGGERLIADILAEGVAQVDASYDSRYANNIAFIWAGLNDLYPGVITAADVLAGLETWCLARRVAGFKTIVCTLHSTPAYTYSEAQRALVNAALLELPAWLDAVCDSGSDPLLDPDDDTMYQEDGVHLTQLAQETVIAPHMVTAIQSLET
jgi:lysophospholipase L1-like esterase